MWESCFVNIYLLQKDTQTIAISFECLPVFRKILDIRGGGHIVFGADPVGVGVSLTLSCVHDIS